MHPALGTHRCISPPECHTKQSAVPEILQVLWSDDLMRIANMEAKEDRKGKEAVRSEDEYRKKHSHGQWVSYTRTTST